MYVNFGVESNAASWNAARFSLYKNFIGQVYTQLKNKYAAIPFFVSFIVDETSDGYNYAAHLTASTDFIGLSAYPYITVSSSANGNTDPKNFPANYFEKFTSLAPQKPLVIAETGYIAENLNIAAYNLNRQGNAGWQRDYLEKCSASATTKKQKY